MSLPQNNYNQHTSELSSFRKAVASNNKQSIEKHLSHMKNISQGQLSTALFICIENFRLEEQSDECLFLLLRNRANPNCEIGGQTPLIAACKIGQQTMVRYLIQNGAKPDLCSSEGKHPLEFVVNSRKQNYDVAQYLISVMSTVNIQIGKTHIIIVAVERQFVRIFKMLVEKGANLVFNQQTILHVVMKKKFKDLRKKKKFIKQLANRPQFSQSRDKFGKLPIQYEQQDQIKIYFSEIFKPKLRPVPEKQIHHSRIKEKQTLSKEASKEKDIRKKVKQQEPSAVEQEGVQYEENDQEGYQAINTQEDKQKIVEVVEQDQEEKRNEEEKQKIKKASIKILAPAAAVNKKIAKPAMKSISEKSSIIEKSFVIEKIAEKDKNKKMQTEKKTKTQNYSKKNKTFISSKKNQEQQKKQEEPKKKLSVRSFSHKQQQLKKTAKKQCVQSKLEIKQKKTDDDIDLAQKQKTKYNLSESDMQSIKDCLFDMINIIEIQNKEVNQDLISKQVEKIELSEDDYSEDDTNSSQGDNSQALQSALSEEIIKFCSLQQEQFRKRRQVVQKLIDYLQSKMKLCLQSHISHQFSFKVVLYGSQATGMAINESDVDLLIISTLSSQDLMRMFEAYRIFEQEEIDQCKFLKNATIPVIKLTLAAVFEKIKVDITFMTASHRGLRCVELMEQFKLAEPLLLPLVLTLKRLIYAYNLDDPYTGGLSSYSLTLMCIALLQMSITEKSKEKLGKVFMQFLSFYGFQLDYVCQAIIIQPPFHAQHNPYGYQYFYNIYQLPNTLDLTSKLVIYDPLDPVNNVGRCTYRIQCLKNLFRVAYIRIKMHKLSIQEFLKPAFIDLITEVY